jgi:hypothetical protein
VDNGDCQCFGETAVCICRLGDASTLKMEAVGFSETLVVVYLTTQRHILEDSNKRTASILFYSIKNITLFNGNREVMFPVTSVLNFF